CNKNGGDVVYLCFNYKNLDVSSVLNFLRITMPNNYMQMIDNKPDQSPIKFFTKKWGAKFFLYKLLRLVNVALHKSINLNMSHYVRKFQYKLNSAPYTIFLYLKLILSNITLSVFRLILSVLSKNRVDKKHLFVVGCSPRTIYWNG